MCNGCIVQVWMCNGCIVQVWMCNGSILLTPCSRVGHIFRPSNPITWSKGYYIIKNSMRVAEVWMDRYKHYFYEAFSSKKVGLSAVYLSVIKPVLNWANVYSPNILRTLRRTVIRFLIKLLVCRIWFGQSKLYFILNWLVMRCKLRPELAADAQQTT